MAKDKSSKIDLSLLKNLEKSIASHTATRNQQLTYTDVHDAAQSMNHSQDSLHMDVQRAMDKLMMESLNKPDVSDASTQECYIEPPIISISITLNTEVREFEYAWHGKTLKFSENGQLLTDTEKSSLLTELTVMEITSQLTANGLKVKKILGEWLYEKTMENTRASNSRTVTPMKYEKLINDQVSAGKLWQNDTEYLKQVSIGQPSLSEGKHLNRVGFNVSSVTVDELGDFIEYNAGEPADDRNK